MSRKQRGSPITSPHSASIRKSPSTQTLMALLPENQGYQFIRQERKAKSESDLQKIRENRMERERIKEQNKEMQQPFRPLTRRQTIEFESPFQMQKRERPRYDPEFVDNFQSDLVDDKPDGDTNELPRPKPMRRSITLEDLDYSDKLGGGKKVRKRKNKTKKKRKSKGGDPPMTIEQAIKKGLVDKVEEMIDNGIDVNQPIDQGGVTPLDLAVREMVMGTRATSPPRLRSHMRMINMLIEKGADVNSGNYLHKAANTNNVHLIRILIEKGADKYQETNSGNTPLLLAVESGFLDATKALIDGGVDINHRNSHGETAVYRVSSIQDDRFPLLSAQILRFLIDSGADIQIENNWHESPLWIASSNGNLNLVGMLLDAGANVESYDEDGDTPLAIAAQYGKLRTAELLIKYGANIESEDNKGNTPLMTAAERGGSCKKVVQFLLKKGANVNHKNEDELTAADLAEREGHTEIATMLRKHNVNNEVRGYNRPNISSLSTMAYQQAPSGVDKLINDPEVGMKRPFSQLGGKRKTRKSTNKKKNKKTRSKKQKGGNQEELNEELFLIIQQYPHLFNDYDDFKERLINLLKQGADVNATNDDGETTVMWAIGYRNIDVASLLLENGADVNAIINDHTNNGNTALIEVICVYGNMDNVESNVELLLRQPEIDVNAMNNEGVTALMCASSQGHTEIVRMLLEKGAEVNAPNVHDGETALMAASESGRAEVVSLLLENGANLNATNDDGETALMIASKNGRADVLSLLLKRREENIKKANLVTKKGTTKDGRPLVPHSQKDIASHIASFAGGKRKTRKSTNKRKNKKTRSKKQTGGNQKD